MSGAVLLTLICTILALVAAIVYTKRVLTVDITGTTEEVSKFREISGAIQEGSMAFLRAEYSYVAWFCLFFSVLIAFALNTGHSSINTGLYSAFAFLLQPCWAMLCSAMPAAMQHHRRFGKPTCLCNYLCV